MNLGSISAAQIADNILDEFFSDEAIRSKHQKKNSIAAKRAPHKLNALGVSNSNSALSTVKSEFPKTPGANPYELSKDFLDFDNHVSKFLKEPSAISDEKLADRINPLLVKLMEVYEVSNKALKRLAIGGDDDGKYSNVVSKANEDFVNICKDMIAEVSKGYKNKIAKSQKLVEAMRNDLIEMKEAAVKTKVENDSQLKNIQEIEYERNILKKQLKDLDIDQSTTRDELARLETQSKYDYKMIQQLREKFQEMVEQHKQAKKDMHEKYEYEMNKLKSQLQTAQEKNVEDEKIIRTLYMQSISSKVSSTTVKEKKVTIEEKKRSPQKKVKIESDSEDEKKIEKVEDVPIKAPISEDTISIDGIASAIGVISDFKMPKVSSSTQTLTDNLGFWDTRNSTFLSPSDGSNKGFYHKNLVLGGTLNSLQGQNESQRSESKEKYDKSDKENEKFFSDENKGEKQPEGTKVNWVPESLIEKDSKMKKEKLAKYRFTVPQSLLNFVVNLPISIQAQPVRPLKWCIAQVHRLLTLKARYNAYDFHNGVLNTQNFGDFLIEFALLENGARQSAETYLYWLLATLKKYGGLSNRRGTNGGGSGTHPLLHSFSRFLECFEPTGNKLQVATKKSSQFKNQSDIKPEDLIMIGEVPIEPHDEIKTVGAIKANQRKSGKLGSQSIGKIEEADEIDNKAGHTGKDDIKIKITDCSLSSNMLNAYLFVRSAMLADYYGLYNSKTGCNNGATLEYIWNSNLQRKRRRLFDKEYYKSSIQAYYQKGDNKIIDNSNSIITDELDELEKGLNENEDDDDEDYDDSNNNNTKNASKSTSGSKNSSTHPDGILPKHVLLDDMNNLYVPLDRVIKVVTHCLGFMSDSVLVSLVREIEYYCTKIVNTSNVVNGKVRGEHILPTSKDREQGDEAVSNFGDLQTPESNHSIIREATRKIQICEEIFKANHISNQISMKDPDVFRELTWEYVEKVTTRANSTIPTGPSEFINDSDVSNSPTIKNIIVLCNLDRCMQLITEALLIRWNFVDIKLQQMYSDGDTNKDGKLSFSEFNNIVSKISSGISGRNILKMFRDALMSSRDNSETIDSIIFSNTCKKFGLIEVIDTNGLRKNQLRELFDRKKPINDAELSNSGEGIVNRDLLPKFSGKTRNGFQNLQGISKLLMENSKKFGKLINPTSQTHMNGITIDNRANSEKKDINECENEQKEEHPKATEKPPSLPTIGFGSALDPNLLPQTNKGPNRLLEKLRAKIKFSFDEASNEETNKNPDGNGNFNNKVNNDSKISTINISNNTNNTNDIIKANNSIHTTNNHSNIDNKSNIKSDNNKTSNNNYPNIESARSNGDDELLSPDSYGADDLLAQESLKYSKAKNFEFKTAYESPVNDTKSKMNNSSSGSGVIKSAVSYEPPATMIPYNMIPKKLTVNKELSQSASGKIQDKLRQNRMKREISDINDDDI